MTIIVLKILLKIFDNFGLIFYNFCFLILVPFILFCSPNATSCISLEQRQNRSLNWRTAEWVKRMSRSFEPYGEIRIIVVKYWTSIFNYFCSKAYFCFKKNLFCRQNYNFFLKYAKIFAYFRKKQYFCSRFQQCPLTRLPLWLSW